VQLNLERSEERKTLPPFRSGRFAFSNNFCYKLYQISANYKDQTRELDKLKHKIQDVIVSFLWDNTRVDLGSLE
jgi:hypothetical protein